MLAQRYGRAYGVSITPILKRVEYKHNRNNLFDSIPTTGSTLFGAMMIMCVDSAEARRNILSMIEPLNYEHVSQSNFVIDAGNENNYGQVKFFSITPWRGSMSGNKSMVNAIPKNTSTVIDVEGIPYPKEFYQDLVDAPSQGSCAELDQTLAINALMATTIMGVVQNFYYVKPFLFNEVCVSLEGNSYTTFNTVQNFGSKVTNWYAHRYIEAYDQISLYSTSAHQEVAEREEKLVRALKEEHRLKKELEAAEKAVAEATEAVPVEELLEVVEQEEAPKKPTRKKQKAVQATEAVEAEQVPPMPTLPPPVEVRAAPALTQIR